MALYKDSECCDKTTEGRTRYFRVLSGVEQGCVLSPFLLTLAIDHLLRNTGTRSIQLNVEHQINDLDFAEDITLIESYNKDYKNY